LSAFPAWKVLEAGWSEVPSLKRLYPLGFPEGKTVLFQRNYGLLLFRAWWIANIDGLHGRRIFCLSFSFQDHWTVTTIESNSVFLDFLLEEILIV
jgi:hypothetical protein